MSKKYLDSWSNIGCRDRFRLVKTGVKSCSNSVKCMDGTGASMKCIIEICENALQCEVYYFLQCGLSEVKNVTLLKLVNLTLTDEVVDENYGLRLGFCPSLNCHIMITAVNWHVCYHRYFALTAEAFMLAKRDIERFVLYHLAWMNGDESVYFVPQFLGADNMRDYDCADDILALLPSSDCYYNAHVVMNGCLWACIHGPEDYILISPKCIRNTGDSLVHPLRDVRGVRNIYIERNQTLQSLCYGVAMSDVDG